MFIIEFIVNYWKKKYHTETPRDLPNLETQPYPVYDYSVDEYENCEPSEIGKRYKNDPAMRLTEAIVPVVIESEAVQDTFEWARFINENGIADEILNHPVVRLAEKLFNKHRLLDYHRILFDIPYREKLISE